MTPTALAILAVLLSLPAHSLDTETAYERVYRLEPVAIAIATVTDDIDEQAALITNGQIESGFAERVQELRCRPRECDLGKSRGVFQIHRGTVDARDWYLLGVPGHYSQVVGARVALKVWRYSVRVCRGSLPCARARYRGESRVNADDRKFPARVWRMSERLRRARHAP